MIRVSVACDGSVFRTCVGCVALTPRCLFAWVYTPYIHFRDPEPEPESMNQRSRVLRTGLDRDRWMDGVAESKLSILVGLLSWSGEVVVVRGSLRSPLRVRSGLYSVDYGRRGMNGNIFRFGAKEFQIVLF